MDEEDEFLTTADAARLLNVSEDWIYRRAHRLPFERRLSRKALRFSRAGLLKWRAAKASVKYELALLKRVFTLYRKLLPVRPSFPVLHLNNVRKGFFEELEFRTFLANIDEDLQPVMEFAYLTGWRIKSEVRPLRWGLNVDMSAGEVRLEPGSTKNDEGRVFPFSILPKLTDVLTQQRRRTQAIEKATGRFVPWVFHRGGNRLRTLGASGIRP